MGTVLTNNIQHDGENEIIGVCSSSISKSYFAPPSGLMSI